MLPVIAHNILESISILANSASNFVDRCIDGIKANEEVCKDYENKVWQHVPY
ncbi:MAG: hypothetical protein R3A13_05240 [Bdellovibrionota bacterium]